MILVHGTSKDASSKIISSNLINPSQFNFKLYLKSLFALSSKEEKPPKNLNGQHVMWLGEGIYAVCGKINVHTIAAQKYTTPQAA